MPEWVTSNKTDGSFTQALRTETPLGIHISDFKEKLEKTGFEPGWGRSYDGHLYATYAFGILPCGIEWIIIYDFDEKGILNFLTGRVSRACL